MKLLTYFLYAVTNTFFTSATPNLFGSVKRRKEKEALAADYKQQAADTAEDILQKQIENPFESAAAKSAMAASTRKARQTQKRFANVIGGQTNPEALVGAQQATQEAIANTAGDIAVGAEAQKKAELAQLRGEKTLALDKSAQLRQAAVNERGSGWRDFFSMIQGTKPFSSAAMKGAASAVTK